MSRPVPLARTWSLLLPLLLGAPALGQEAERAPADGDPAPEEVERAGEVFRASCLTCHRVPDLRFELDRAWLGQVQDTA